MDFSSSDGDVIAINSWMLDGEDRELSSAEIASKYGEMLGNDIFLLDFGSTRIKLYGIEREEDVEDSIELF